VKVAAASLIVSSLMTDAQLYAWGWRLPFLFSIVLVIVGLWIRFTIAESPQFQKIKESQVKMPIVDAIRTYPKNILLAMGTRFAENGFFYIYATFTLAYAMQALGMKRQHPGQAQTLLLSAAAPRPRSRRCFLPVRAQCHPQTHAGGIEGGASTRPRRWQAGKAQRPRQAADPCGYSKTPKFASITWRAERRQDYRRADAIKRVNPASWKHVNLHGAYSFLDIGEGVHLQGLVNLEINRNRLV
jgi:hypothetical protein